MGLNLIENGVDRAIAAVDKIRSMITGYDEGLTFLEPIANLIDEGKIEEA